MICYNLSTTSITITINIFYPTSHTSIFELITLPMFSPLVSSPCHPLIFHRITPNHLLTKLIQSFINVASSSTNSNTPKNNDKICNTHKETKHISSPSSCPLKFTFQKQPIEVPYAQCLPFHKHHIYNLLRKKG